MKNKILSILVVGLLTACSTTPTGGQNQLVTNAEAFAKSDAGKQFINAVVGASVGATVNVAAQYASTGKIDPQGIVGAALQGGAAQLRAIPNVAPFQVPVVGANAVVVGAGVPAVSEVVAPLVQSQIKSQIVSGTTPGQAIENVATALNIAAVH